MKYFLMGLAGFLMTFHANAIELTDKLTADVLIAGTYQAISADGTDNPDGTAVPAQVEIDWELSEKSRLYTKLGFAHGDGLNDDSSFQISPWAANLESDVKDINGTDRDYLLTAWYRHTFIKKEDQHFDIALGLIDGTDYLDQNEYSNDEYTQFMNSALVNAPNVFIPSYNPGAALVYGKGAFSTRIAYMRLKENSDGNEGDYFAAELDYLISTPLGYGKYRVTLAHTNNSYFALYEDGMVTRKSIVFSFDQQLGNGIGAFTRFGIQDDKASIDYKSIISGGLQFEGENWSRTGDTAGLGIANLQDGNEGITRSRVFEVYYRFILNDHFDATLDVQHMSDEYKNSADDVSGWVYGLRLVASL